MKFYKDITPVWECELEKAFKGNPNQKVVLMSPYITYPGVLKAFPSSSCEVYTVFSTENFINRSSSARALKKIHELGCKLYHLPDLHAKMLIIPGQFVSVGSQNLTNRSRRKNLEASVVFRDSAEVKRIWKKVEEWTHGCEEITLEKIKYMLEEIKEIRRFYAKEIRQKAEKIDTSIRERAKRREEKERQRRERARQAEEEKERERLELHERLRQLVKTVSELPQSKEIKYGKITILPKEYSPGRRRKIRNIFKIDSSSGYLTEWIIDGTQQSLTEKYEKFSRYLCILGGRMSWGRVGDTQISLFSQRVDEDESLYIDSTSCELSYSFVWDTERLSQRENLEINIKPDKPKYDNFSIKLKTWFSIKDLKLIGIEVSPFDSDEGNSLSEFISGHREEILEKILDRMLKPFKYEIKLRGGRAVEASTFLGNHGSRFSVRLCQIEGNPVLVFSGPL